jgi:hypothetical protein
MTWIKCGRDETKLSPLKRSAEWELVLCKSLTSKAQKN